MKLGRGQQRNETKQEQREVGVGQVAQVQCCGDEKGLMPGEVQVVCDTSATLPGFGADVYPSLYFLL